MEEINPAEEILKRLNTHENIVMSPSIVLPIKLLQNLLREHEDLNHQIKKCNKKTIEQETVEKCLQIIKNYADHVTTEEYKNLGDGTVKNMALHEVIGLLKKEFNSYSFTIC